MTTRHAVLLLCAVELVATGMAQGQSDLDPPPTAFATNGMPVSIMKSLNQIEPRSMIGAIPFDIMTPGSYYLSPTSALVARTGTNGITICSSNVRLDLNGFVLVGTNTAFDGIQVRSGCSDVVIRNGIIAGWGGFGIFANSAPEITITDIKSVQNSKGGIYAGDNAFIERCSVYANGFGDPQWNDGINAGQYSTINECKSRGNRGANIHGQAHNRVIGCTAVGSANANGIFLEDGCTVRDCDVSYNMVSGIRVGGMCRVIENSCGRNGTNNFMADPAKAGIRVEGTNSIIQGNLVCGNGRGVSSMGTGNLIINNAASKNGSGPGFDYTYDTPQIASNNFSGATTVLNTSGGGGGSFSNNNPWANFSFTSP